VWPERLRDIARGITQLVFPNSCLICDSPELQQLPFRHGLCRDCYGAVTSEPSPSCPRCASTVGPNLDTEDGCIRCRNTAISFRSVFRLGVYEGRLRDAVIRMKLSSGEALAVMLGRVFCETAGASFRAAGIDGVIPVPLHWRRRWQRGYNQAAAIATELATGLSATVFMRELRRVRYTPQQLQPSAAARRENVRGAFRVHRGSKLNGKRILLVDDVMTTGSTASEAARVLRQAGAREVIVAILARR